MKRAAALAALTACVVAMSACSGSPATAGRTFALNGTRMADCALSSLAAAKCGQLKVEENPAEPKGRVISLAVDVIPATSSDVGPPVFFIAGGPGSSTIDQWTRAPSLFAGLNTHHDIVLVDQRGTGQSHQLVLPQPLPDESPAQYAQRALASMDGDPRYYTTAAAMDDLDAVRQALGYSKIDLYGGSYGATAVQYYLRQHGDHAAAAVIDGGTLIDVPIFELIAVNSQRALDDVFARCRADQACEAAFPQVAAEFVAVMDRLAGHPVTTDTLDARGQRVVVTQDAFAGTIHRLMLAAATAATIPRVVHRASQGNFVDVAQNVATASDDSSLLVMSVVIRCSEAWARFDPARVVAAGASSYLTASELESAKGQALICSYAPPGFVYANDARPVHSNVPVLLLNGGADPQDPPSNVAEALQQMPNSFTVVAPGQGHTVGHIGCLSRLVVRFYDSGRTDPAAAYACASSITDPAFVTG